MSQKLPIVSAEAPWYKEGVPFKCTGCGQCCTGGPGAVWINDKEIKAMADHLDLSVDDFIKNYTCIIDGRRSLKEKDKNYDCIFLEGNKCGIYNLRPKQCRTYPFWPQHMKSEKAWKEASKWCEGIDPEQPVVPFEEIQKQLTIQLEN